MMILRNWWLMEKNKTVTGILEAQQRLSATTSILKGIVGIGQNFLARDQNILM